MAYRPADTLLDSLRKIDDPYMVDHISSYIDPRGDINLFDFALYYAVGTKSILAVEALLSNPQYETLRSRLTSKTLDRFDNLTRGIDIALLRAAYLNQREFIDLLRPYCSDAAVYYAAKQLLDKVSLSSEGMVLYFAKLKAAQGRQYKRKTVYQVLLHIIKKSYVCDLSLLLHDTHLTPHQVAHLINFAIKMQYTGDISGLVKLVNIASLQDRQADRLMMHCLKTDCRIFSADQIIELVNKCSDGGLLAAVESTITLYKQLKSRSVQKLNQQLGSLHDVFSAIFSSARIVYCASMKSCKDLLDVLDRRDYEWIFDRRTTRIIDSAA